MSSEWIPFTELLTKIIDNRGKTCPVGEIGIPLIATNCINNSTLYPIYNTTRFVDQETYKNWFRGHPEPGDILFVCKGSPGRTNWVPDPVDFCIAQDMVAVRANPERIYPKYLFAALRSSIVLSQIDNMHVGTMIPHFKKGDFDKLKIPVLSSQEAQVFTGDLYFTISERIDGLQKTNATLEAIAQALFKSWFVDFDPVHAKARGEPPQGMDDATAALFPDSFEESELGMIPKGWQVLAVSDVASIVKGKSYSSKDLVDSHDTALVTLKSFERGGGFRLDGFKPYTGTYKPGQVVTPGDLIIAYTDVTQAAELIGKPAIVVGVENYQTLIASLDVGIVRPNENQVSRQYLYGLFRTDLFQSHTFAHTTGTTVLHLAKDGVGSFAFTCPPAELVKKFSEITEYLSERQQVNIDQMRSLAQLRDTLLPKLISGQLRQPEAEALLAEELP